ncbi:MAG TPA: Clp protease [Microscillaceae bacterium]|nr:Clp protease [Microscillaceae bacterium]
MEDHTYAYTYFDIQNVAGDTAHILLYDKIGVTRNKETGTEEGISGKRFAEELYALARQYRRINVRINSPGGRVTDGLSICAVILNINKSVKGVRIDTYVDGLALSIAGLIAVCGKRVYMCNFAQLMLHNPFVSSNKEEDGNSTAPPASSAEQHKTLYQIKEMLLTLLATRTGLTAETLSQMMNQTTWLGAEEAKTQGFVDEIFDHPKKKVMANSVAEAAAANDATALFEVFNAYPVEIEAAPTAIPAQPQSSINTNLNTNSNPNTHMSTTPGTSTTQSPVAISVEEVERLRNEAVSFKGDFSAITNACGLPTDSSRENIIGHINAQAEEIKRLKTLELSIDNFQTNIDNLEQQNKKLTEQVTEMKKYEADNLIDTAIRQGKIAPAKKEKWLNHAYDNYEMVRDTLADMPVHPALASKVNAMGLSGNGEAGGSGNSPGFDQMSFSELSNQNPEKLALIKNENPTLYRELFRKEYGVDPSL